MAVLDSQFEILRGWPDGSAVAEDFAIGGKSTNPHTAGKWVALDAASPASMKTADSNPSSSASVKCFLIIEGDEESSSKMSGTVTCMLGGGYVVRLHNRSADEMFDTEHGGGANWAYTPGMPVKITSGIIAPAFLDAANGNALAALDAAAYAADDVKQLEARAAVVGHVVRFDAAAAILEVYIR